MDFYEFETEIIGGGPELTPECVKNIEVVQSLGKKFHKKAGTLSPQIDDALNRLPKELTKIIEVAHQPNFLPYLGIFRKAAISDYLVKRLSEKKQEVLALFGFVDTDGCTNEFIGQNKIPASNLQGYKRIGFKIEKDDRRSHYDVISKPSEEAFGEQVKIISENYGSAEKEKVTAVEDLLWESYRQASTFAELNEYFISKLVNDVWGLGIVFFTYSDVQKQGLFADVWAKIIVEIKEFNKHYNDGLKTAGFPPTDTEKYFPFWYHCGCGAKVALEIESFNPLIVRGTCPLCENEANLEFDEEASQLNEYFPDMSVRAVTRNLVYGQGLGSAVYVSGSGGGLRYGILASEIAAKMDFTQPKTLAWKGQDLYIGVVHEAVLNDLFGTLGLSKEQLPDSKDVATKIKDFKADSIKEIRRLEEGQCKIQKQKAEIYKSGLTNDKKEEIESLKKEESKLKGEIQSQKNRYQPVEKALNVFSLTPSIIDLLVSHGLKSDINSTWNHALSKAAIKDDGWAYLIKEDVIHETEHYNTLETKTIYETMKELEKND
ncbi:MAG: hypothetical protein ABH950_09805 [Candidatus Altiarchaeota archaeon]